MPPPHATIEASATVSLSGAELPHSDSLFFRFRWALLPIACGAAVSVLLFQMATDSAVWAFWSRWFPAPMRPVFHDLWITLQHFREAAIGLDPLADPESQYAYPRAVLLLRHLGLHDISSAWLGAIQAAVLTTGIVLVMRPFTRRRAVGTSLLFFTPPMMLAMERGNLDGAIFLLCAIAAWQWSRSRRLHQLGRPILALAAGAVLKIYPVFAMVGAALAETGRRRVAWLISIALVTGYWALNSDELGLVADKVPVPVASAWGCLIFFARVDWYLDRHPGVLTWLHDVNWTPIAIAGYMLAAIAAAIVGLRLAGPFSSTRVNRTEWSYYWVGAIICCGAFLGSNYAYRWVIILMTLPLLLRCARAQAPAVAVWARLTLATIFISLISAVGAQDAVFAVVQAVNWACMLLLIVGCTAMRASTKSPILAPIIRWLAPKPQAAGS